VTHRAPTYLRRLGILGLGGLVGALAVVSLLGSLDGGVVPPTRHVTDVTELIDIPVERVVQPRSHAEIQALLQRHDGPVSIGGGRYSMGGQIGTRRTLFLDLREHNDVLELDPTARTVRVEAGITWRALIEALDPHDLSVKIMQSYANFTVGGTLSVNAHGRYVS